MKGYKGMKSDMTCRGMQYEVGKSYHVDGAIDICRNKSAASDLTVVRELEDIEINRIVYGNGNGYGDGNGYGYGDGDGNGYGYGNGYGKAINRILLFV